MMDLKKYLDALAGPDHPFSKGIPVEGLVELKDENRLKGRSGRDYPSGFEPVFKTELGRRENHALPFCFIRWLTNLSGLTFFATSPFEAFTRRSRPLGFAFSSAAR